MRKVFPLRCAIAFALFAPLVTSSLQAADTSPNWPHWRGPADIGSTETGAYPVKFDANAGVLWKVTLPGNGCSTPIVFDRKICVTAPVEGQDALLAYDWWKTSLADNCCWRQTGQEQQRVGV